MPFIFRLSLRGFAYLLVLVAAFYVVRAVDSRRLPDPGPEHRIRFENEFSADQELGTDWISYRAIEDRLSAELESAIPAASRSRSLVDRHSPTSLTSPDRVGMHWNRSYELATATPRGVAVLLHGLTDSPYSMRATAETLVIAGYHTVVPRLPGHGFAVGGLRQARWDDWTAAVRIAARHAEQLPGAKNSFLIVGYSNGALLAIDYALNCLDQETHCPDSLILI